MHYYSYAGDARGIADPEETFCMDVEGGDCDLHGCSKNDCEHKVLMWSGNGYTKDRTWIACNDKYTVNLQETR